MSLPKSLTAWLLKHHADKFRDGDSEDDGFNPSGGLSHWVYLKPGWCRGQCDDGNHSVHEATVKEVKEAFRWVARCECDDCQKAT